MEIRHFDAIVVGLGAAGCWAAKALTGRGLRTAALDAGRMLSPEDLPAGVRPLSRTLRPASYWHKLLFGHHTTQARATSFHPQVEHLYVDDKANPYSTRGGDQFLWIRGRQIGGRLHTWARMALRLSEDDFKRAERDGCGIPWPLSYSDLDSYYCEVERFHGLSAGCDGIPWLPDGCVSQPGRFTEPALLFKRKVEARWPERRVVLPRILKDHAGPVHSPLSHALETGLLELIAEAPVSRVILNKAGDRAAGVEYVGVREGQRKVLHADLVFLCASSIETVRILLNSRCAAHPTGVGDSSGLLGRYLLDHNFVVAAGTPSDEYRSLPWVPRRSTPLDLSTDLDFYIPDLTRALPGCSFVRGFGMQGTISPDHWAIASFGEMLPHPGNRVTLCRKTDAYGIPAVNIAVRRHENDRRMIEAQKRCLREIAAVAGLDYKMPLPAPVRGVLWRCVGPEVGVLHLGLAIHECGGARMGSKPSLSVTNRNNQLWDVPNLYVTDGACFPNTGCQNPTLTIMALTARACAIAAAGQAASDRTSSIPA